jgi:hypothetical protein
MPALASLDQIIANDAAYGSLRRFIWGRWITTTTAANSTSGYATVRRAPFSFTMPSMGTGVPGAICTYFRMSSANGAGGVGSDSLFTAIEFTLGTLTVSGNSFAAGVTMPVRSANGMTALQTASVIPVVVVTTALTGATTPALTITYTNQAAAGSKTASLTLPSNPAINTAFYIHPHLASGDTGIQAVTNMSISTGTAGVLKVMGLLPLGFATSEDSGNMATAESLSYAKLVWQVQGSDVIAFYQTGKTALDDLSVALNFVADV